MSRTGTWRFAENTTLVAEWTPNTGTPYKVEHYTENLDGTWVLQDTDNLFGTSDSEVTPATKTYTGFTAPAAQTVSVAPDGTLVVRYEYTRNSYTVTFVTNGGDGIAAHSLKYGTTLPTPVRTGYTFGGWFTNISLTTAVTTVPANNITLYAYWAEENKPADFSYHGGDSITIEDYLANGTSVVIPAYIGGKLVTSIGKYAFSGFTGLMSITIPVGVTSIPSYAFSGCYKLIEVYNLSALNIEADYSSYGDVGYYAKNVYTATTGSSKLFTDSNGYIFYADGNTRYLMGYTRTNTFLTLPKNCNGESYEIYQYAFYYRDLISITIPEGVTSIGNCAFDGCTGLTSITIPASVTSIGSYAFSSCTGLTRITIPEGVTSIGYSAFDRCTGLQSVTFGEDGKLTSIGDRAFEYCKRLTSITIPASVTSIGEDAFEGCVGLIQNVYGVSYVDRWVIACDSTVTAVTLRANTVGIGDNAFEDCTRLTSITIPASVISIGRYAFSGCTSLASIVIPASVTSIGSYAFRGCTGLASVTFENAAGWWYAIFSTGTNGTAISASSLANPATAAEYLTSTHYYYYWKRG